MSIHVYLTDEALWRQARMLALELGLPVKQMVEDALRVFVASRGAASPNGHGGPTQEKVSKTRKGRKPRATLAARRTNRKRAARITSEGTVTAQAFEAQRDEMNRKIIERVDVLPDRCANEHCRHPRLVHRDGTGRCDHCLAACPAFVEAE